MGSRRAPRGHRRGRPRPSRLTTLGASGALGASGEDAAANWYAARGYRIVARNWRCREGELDIVAVKHGTVVICEVKTRSSHAFGAPVEAVTTRKQRRLRTLAARWLRENRTTTEATAAGEIRFDVASVMGDDVEVLEAAF